MVTRTEPLSIIRQCELLDLPRSTFYHVPTPVSEADLELMKLIDRCHMNMAINKTGYDQSVPSIQMLNIRAITIRDNLVATNTDYFAAVDQHCFGPWPVRVCGEDSSASN